MDIRAIMDDQRPDKEPDQPQGPEHIEHRLPAQELTQVGGGWHGYHRPKCGPGCCEGCEPS